MSNDPTYNVGLSGAQIKDLLTSINFPSLAEKLTRHDDDNLLVWDSEDANKAKKIKASNLIPRVSNKNLLHNWDFTNPVNQRGQSSYADVYLGKYTIDRWCGLTPWGTTPANVTIQPGVGIEIESVPNPGVPNATGWLVQKIENAAAYSGMTLTFSVEVASVQATEGGLYPQILLGEDVIGSPYVEVRGPGIYSITRTLGTIADLLVAIGVCAGAATPNAVVVKRAKLELGTISTLAYDPPADYGEELRKCQRYYQRYKSGGSGLMIADMRNPSLSSAIQGKFCLVTPMRITPSLESYSGTPTWYNATGGSVVATNVDVYAAYSDNQHLDIRFYRTYEPSQGDYGTGFLVGENAYIAFSAEL